jgi:cation:H+ antiporter
LNLLWHALIFLAALVAIAWVAERIVEAVLAVARHLGLSGSIAGATLAAVATSAPELGTMVFSLIRAHGDMAAPVANVGVATVVGSAIFNLTIVVGLAGIRNTSILDRKVILRDGVVYLGSVLLLIGMLVLTGDSPRTLSRGDGLVLLAAYLVYLVWLSVDRRRGPKYTQISQDSNEDRPSCWQNIAILLGGSILIGAACHFLVASTEAFALSAQQAFELDASYVASVVSLILIAGVTSAPDALTSFAAARRGHASLAISNALGSNTFDILICLGLPFSVFGAYTVSSHVVFNGYVLLGITVAVLLALIRGWSMTRTKGYLFVVLYLTFAFLAIGNR